MENFSATIPYHVFFCLLCGAADAFPVAFVFLLFHSQVSVSSSPLSWPQAEKSSKSFHPPDRPMVNP